jgi:hypothetical protein
LPKLQIILGRFQPKTVRCDAECRQQYVVPEEKKTDVNIAVHMLSDAIAQVADAIVLISGDSDQEPTIQWIHQLEGGPTIRNVGNRLRRTSPNISEIREFVPTFVLTSWVFAN